MEQIILKKTFQTIEEKRTLSANFDLYKKFILNLSKISDH